MSSSHSPDHEKPARVLAIIPARYGSTRFPGKPLVLIDGKPMIQHVWERTRQAPEIDRVVVATDDARIADAVRDFGGEVRLTSPSHPSGTDRMWEVARDMPEFDWILNVQGDEPHIDPAVLSRTIQAMRGCPEAALVTLVTPIGDVEERENPNIVKAVLSERGQALYFSRAPLPHYRDAEESPAAPTYRHIGLYLYRREALERFTSLPPSPLERAEKLEQLRALEHGMKIFAVVVEEAPIGIDTPEDLNRLEMGMRMSSTLTS